MKFWKPFWNSTSAKGQIILTSVLIIIIIILLFNGRSHSISYAQIWQNRIDPVLTIGTILIASFIWYSEKKQNWENNLPMKLNVFFRHNDQVFYQVENAPLAGSDDVRQWGQQLGRQIHGGDLSFNGFSVEVPVPDTDSNGKDVMRYELTVWLLTTDNIKEKKKWIYDDEGRFLEEKQLESSNPSASPTNKSV